MAGSPAQSIEIQRQDTAARMDQDAEAAEEREAGGPVGRLYLQGVQKFVT